MGTLRFAFRNLRRGPLFTTVAIASLALGIGANTAIFTILDQLILRLLPVRHPEQLVMIWSTGPHIGNNNGARSVSYPMYQDYQQKAEPFSYVFGRLNADASVSFGSQTERVSLELVSGNYFQALGVQPAVGHLFTPEQDDRTYKGHPHAVLDYGYWTTRFAADPGVVGRKILVNNYPIEIVGVSPAGFTGLNPSSAPAMRIPIQMKPLMTPGWDDMGDRRSQWLQVFARLKPGYTVERAKAAMQPLFHQILNYELQQPEMRETSAFLRARFLERKVMMESAATGYSPLRNGYSTALKVLMGMVGLVLLIACFNVANLLIARAVARQKEIAVRLAVGASRLRLLGQLALESLILAVAGGLAGLLLSEWMVQGLLRLVQGTGAPLLIKPTPDWRILAFNAGLVLATTALFGLAPALQVMRVQLWSALKDVVGAIAGGGGSVRLRKFLVTAQVVLSFLLLAGAGLFVKTLANLRQTNTGFRDLSNLITFQVDPSLSGYDGPRMREFYRKALEGVRALPGVQAASWAEMAVLYGNEWDSTLSVEGHRPKDGEDMQAFMNAVSPGYFKSIGTPILAGRDFDEQYAGAGWRYAIVNRAFATHFFGAESPIGKHVAFGDRPRNGLNIEIIGMVENALYEGPREGVHRQVFVPGVQDPFIGHAAFYIRTSMSAASMFSAVRRQFHELDSAMPLYEVKTLDTQLDEALATERLIAMLSAAFGGVATLLASLGLYGVMAFVVARRTREIGLRMALGASQQSVLWMVLRESLLLLGMGLAVGAPLAWWLSHYVSTQLYGVKPADVGTGVLAMAILAVVAAASGFVPARRASTIDPTRALRWE